MDSCHDVLLLHLGSAEDPLPVEKVPDAGSAVAICFGGWLHHHLLHSPTPWHVGYAIRGSTL